MTGSLEIIKSGLMTSIQDIGRKGLAYYGIPVSGVMDENAAKIALLLLGKNESEAVIECTSIAPEIEFKDDTKIAISGADFGWKINSMPVQLNQILHIKPGDCLKGKFAKSGMRGYIALAGKLDINPIYSSHSTYTNAKLGGYEGRLLQKGDILTWSQKSSKQNDVIEIHKGPEYDWLSKEAKDLLLTATYKIKPDTNRMGMRLDGQVLTAKSYQLPASSPILPGFIQLPPNGQPIVVLQDGQTIGGYPRIAYLKKSMINKLNQIPIGHKINFYLTQ